MAKKTVEKRKPASGGRGFSERYYQEQIAELVMENRKLKEQLDRSLQNAEDWMNLSERWEKTSSRFEEEARRNGRLLKIAMWCWTAIWIIDIAVGICLR